MISVAVVIFENHQKEKRRIGDDQVKSLRGDAVVVQQNHTVRSETV